MTARLTKSTYSISVRTYDELGQYIRAFAKGTMNLVILEGPPGVAKSQTARQALGQAKHCYLQGNATAFGMYQALYLHRDELVVIDDVDALYRDKASVRLLKCLCQTDREKTLAWHTAAVGKLQQAGLPREFQTTSRTLIIANDFKVLDANVEAVMDRGHHLVFHPSAEEVHQETAKWFTDKEVLDWFGAHLHLVAKPSMRHYVRAAELRAAGLDWLRVVMSDIASETTLLVARLKADASYVSEEERVAEFVARGGGCRATYFNHAKKLKPPKAARTTSRRLRAATKKTSRREAG